MAACEPTFWTNSCSSSSSAACAGSPADSSDDQDDALSTQRAQARHPATCQQPKWPWGFRAPPSLVIPDSHSLDLNPDLHSGSGLSPDMASIVLGASKLRGSLSVSVEGPGPLPVVLQQRPERQPIAGSKRSIAAAFPASKRPSVVAAPRNTASDMSTEDVGDVHNLRTPPAQPGEATSQSPGSCPWQPRARRLLLAERLTHAVDKATLEQSRQRLADWLQNTSSNCKQSMASALLPPPAYQVLRGSY